MKVIKTVFVIFITLVTIGSVYGAESNLSVSEDGRYLIYREGGAPFFLTFDTGWGVFELISKEDAEIYLKDRRDKGFNGFLGCLIFPFGNPSNYYGEKPLHNFDPNTPNEEYFKNADYVINKAIELGLFVGLLPSWGDKVTRGFTLKNAYRYGWFLGNRYVEQNANIIWVIGGDRNPTDEVQENIYRKIAEGVADGVNNVKQEDGRADYSTTMMTFHPQPEAWGGGSSSTFYHYDEWLDFNMLQTSHFRRNDERSYTDIQSDYSREPVKPCMEGEPPYEDHAVDWKTEKGFFTDHDIRKAAYWSVFAGAAGHVYGSTTVWQFSSPTHQLRRYEPPTRGWWNIEKDGRQKGKDLPGAFDMRHLKDLMLSRPYFSRIPDLSLIDESGPGKGHLQCTKDTDGNYAFIYFPMGTISLKIYVSKLSGKKINAWWYSPRDGKVYDNDGKLTNAPFLVFDKKDREFDPPRNTETEDWILILDDASKNYPVPGKEMKTY
ncbi:glycoside hydrolase family 140 protein [candidate division KSB1 bacterium]